MTISKQQTVCITGGAQRIGKHIALSLAEAGYDIALHYRHSKEQAEELRSTIQSMGRACSIASADFNDAFDANRLFNELSANDAPITHLINNASIFQKDTLKNLTRESFDLHMHANLLAATQCCAAFSANAHAQSIINISDGIEGWSMSSQFLSYALSKRVIENLTELLAPELAPRIRINTLALGPSLIGEMDGEDVFDKLAAASPLNRTSAPQEVCDAVLFLLNAPSVTGQKLALNGGMQLTQKLDAHA
ncbi:MAG: SDR family oxidoreductase [Rickettsiales bacterium]|nr:SDR family oxidoreductase [Rickettsiales bacterium]